MDTIMDLREQMINDLENTYRGQVEDEKLDETIASLKAASTRYNATGSIIGAFFYTRITAQITDGAYPKYRKTFTGNGGGIAFPGAAALVGHIYTDSVEKMYAETKRFQITFAPAYTYILFLDENSKVVGHFQAGSVSTTAGIAGGTGEWG